MLQEKRTPKLVNFCCCLLGRLDLVQTLNCALNAMAFALCGMRLTNATISDSCFP